MRIAVLTEPNHITIQSMRVPAPGQDEVLIRVGAVGICGSDTHYFAGKRDHESQTIYPFVLGHEFAGEVARPGSGVKNVVEGDRVCCAPDLPCGACEWCRKGEANVCPNVRFAGSAGVFGCMSEYYVVKASQLHPIADSVSFEQATLAEPLAIGLHMVDNLIRPEGGECAAVVGVGPIGLCATFALKRRGVEPIYVADRLAPRLEAAKRLGGDTTCLVPATSMREFIDARTDGRGVDIAIEAAGELAAIGETIELSAIHGIVLIEGIPEAGRAALNVDFARRHEMRIVFGRRSLGKTDEALRLIADGAFDTDALITHRLPLADAQAAFEMTRDYTHGAIKVIIEP